MVEGRNSHQYWLKVREQRREEMMGGKVEYITTLVRLADVVRFVEIDEGHIEVIVPGCSSLLFKGSLEDLPVTILG